MRVLVVEDNPKLARLLFRALSEEGYSVELCTSDESALREALRRSYQLLVMGERPMEAEEHVVVEQLRRNGAPILHLTRPLQLDALFSRASLLMTPRSAS